MSPAPIIEGKTWKYVRDAVLSRASDEGYANLSEKIGINFTKL